MMEILQCLGSVAGVVALGLLFIFRKGAQRYVDEKAKNLATIEDAAKITREVEGVKALHLRQSHAWKWVFEKGSTTFCSVFGAQRGTSKPQRVHCAQS